MPMLSSRLNRDHRLGYMESAERLMPEIIITLSSFRHEELIDMKN